MRYRITQRKGGGWYLEKKDGFWSFWEKLALYDTEEEARSELCFILS